MGKIDTAVQRAAAAAATLNQLSSSPEQQQQSINSTIVLPRPPDSFLFPPPPLPPPPPPLNAVDVASRQRLRRSILQLLQSAVPADVPTPSFLQMVAEAVEWACAAPGDLDAASRAAAAATLGTVASAGENVTPVTAAAVALALSSLAHAALNSLSFAPSDAEPGIFDASRRHSHRRGLGQDTSQRPSGLPPPSAEATAGGGGLAAVLQIADTLSTSLLESAVAPGQPLTAVTSALVKARRTLASSRI